MGQHLAADLVAATPEKTAESGLLRVQADVDREEIAASGGLALQIKEPTNKIRFWLFVEKHKDGDLRLHIPMAKMDEMEWLSKRNRKIEIRKSTLLKLIQGDFSIG